MKRVMKVALVSCLLSASAQAQTGSQIFTATTQNTVILLQWTEAAGQLKGSAQVVSVTPGSPNIGLIVDNSGLSGTHSGNDYSLVFDKAILGKGVFSAPATVTKDRLAINIPSESGGLSTVILTRSTLQAFNDSVAQLKVTAQTESQKLARQNAVADAARQVESTVNHINSYFSDIEKLTPPDSRKLDASIHALDVYSKRLTTADHAHNCTLVKYLLGTLPEQINSFQMAIDELSVATGSFPAQFINLSGDTGNYDAAIEKLTALSPTDANNYLKSNASLFKRINLTLAKNQPAFVAAQSTIDTATAQVQKFSDLVAALSCQ